MPGAALGAGGVPLGVNPLMLQTYMYMQRANSMQENDPATRVAQQSRALHGG